jgi:rod shape-determining protein MreB
MQGRAAPAVEILWPVRNGVIIDACAVTAMLQEMLRQAWHGAVGHVRRVLISVPRDATLIERRAFKEAAAGLGASSIVLLEEPVAAAVGAGIDVLARRSRLLVDVGSGITEAVVMAMGRVVAHRSVRLGGDAMAVRIAEIVRRDHELVISTEEADRVKCAVKASALASHDAVLDVKGWHAGSRMPRRAAVTVASLKPVYSGMLDVVSTCVAEALRDCDPEAAADVATDGVWLSGGCLLTPGADAALARRLGLQVQRVSEPLGAVIAGNGVVVEDARLCRALAAD